MKITNGLVQCLNIVVLLLIVLQTVLTFIPYYSHIDSKGQEEKASIQGYVWFDYDDTNIDDDEIDEYFEQEIGYDYNVNDEVTFPAVSLLITALTIGFALFMYDTMVPKVFEVIWGCVGLVGFFVTKTLKLGNLYYLHIAILAIATIIAIANFVFQIKLLSEKKKNKQKASDYSY
ncbi:MAG: hypothetical protein Q4B04_04820 [bacterium]|nr:hypothetical protein [bacterium]